jgi:vacuolar-type H+-ATPase subunit E/Vma4
MSEKIADSVEAIEARAERILAEARNRANEIVVKAKEEARAALSAPMPLDDAKAECDRIVSKARKEADEAIRDSEKKAAGITAAAEKKLEETIELVANIVAGRS